MAAAAEPVTPTTVSVIDVGCLFAGPSADRAAVDAAIGAALSSAGAAVLTGLPAEITVGRAKADQLFSFFDLPAEAKATVANRSGGRKLWGYRSAGCAPPWPSAASARGGLGLTPVRTQRARPARLAVQRPRPSRGG